MSVYVDPMMACVPNANWRWNEACHLTADADDELHAFALRLGMRREWFQVSKSGIRHYDLTRSKRATALALGARALDLHEAGERYSKIRTRSNPMGPPPPITANDGPPPPMPALRAPEPRAPAPTRSLNSLPPPTESTNAPAFDRHEASWRIRHRMLCVLAGVPLNFPNPEARAGSEYRSVVGVVLPGLVEEFEQIMRGVKPAEQRGPIEDEYLPDVPVTEDLFKPAKETHREAQRPAPELEPQA